MLEIIGIYPPAAIDAIEEQHGGKNIAEFAGDAGQEAAVQQQPGAQANINSGHDKAQDQHGIPDETALPEVFVGRHSRNGLVKIAYT